MISRIIKSNHPLSFALPVLLGAALWSTRFIAPQQYPFYEGEERNILFYPVYSLLKNFPLAGAVISLILVLVMSVAVQKINNRYLVIREIGHLPALTFVVMAGGLTGIHTLHPVYFAGVFLTLAIYRLFSAFDKEKPHSAAFDSGFLLGIGSLFYINMFLLVPAFMLSVGILCRKNCWKVFVIQLIGALLPFVFVLSFGMLTERFFEMLKTFEQNIATPNNHFKTNMLMHGYTGFLTVLTIIGCVIIAMRYNTMKAGLRIFFSVFFLILIFLTAGFIFVPATSHEMLVLLFVPLSFIVSSLIAGLKSRFMSGFIFSILLAAVIFLQIIALMR